MVGARHTSPLRFLFDRFMSKDREQKRQKNIAEIAALLVIPLILLILSRVLVNIKGEYYLGWNLDPEYAYLFNSVNLLHLDIPGHYDHPGTTMQELGAVVILARFVLMRVFEGTPSLHLDVITNPEAYLNWINIVLNLLIGGSLFWFGKTLYRHTGKLWLALISQTVPFLFSASVLALTRVTPEPLLIFVGLLISTLIIHEYYSADQFFNSWRANIFLGLLLGFGVASKVTLLPLLILLLASKNLRKMMIGALSTGFSFVLFTIPILPKYLRFVNWLVDLLTHDGIYGGGEAGLPELAKLFDNLLVLLGSEVQYFLWMIILLVVLVGFRSKEKQKSWWLMFLLFLVMFGQAVVTIKHPPAHYMIPAMSLFCLLPVLWVEFSFEKFSQSRLVLFLILGFSLISMSLVSGKEIQRIVTYNQGAAQIDQLIETEYSSCAVADRYRSSGLEFALSFGNDYSDDHNQVSLLSTYPSAITYDKWGKLFSQLWTKVFR